MMVYLRRPRDRNAVPTRTVNSSQPHLISLRPELQPANQRSRFSSETLHVLRTIALSQLIATTNHPNYGRVSDVESLLFGSSCGAILAIVGGAANLEAIQCATPREHSILVPL
jgi:hypothetical protein